MDGENQEAIYCEDDGKIKNLLFYMRQTPY